MRLLFAVMHKKKGKRQIRKESVMMVEMHDNP
jgi:hypothetical protein